VNLSQLGETKQWFAREMLQQEAGAFAQNDDDRSAVLRIWS